MKRMVKGLLLFNMKEKGSVSYLFGRTGSGSCSAHTFGERKEGRRFVGLNLCVGGLLKSREILSLGKYWHLLTSPPSSFGEGFSSSPLSAGWWEVGKRSLYYILVDAWRWKMREEGGLWNRFELSVHPFTFKCKLQPLHHFVDPGSKGLVQSVDT